MRRETSSQGFQAEASVDEDWRFAELVARAWIDPSLSIRYHNNPRTVLAEFGVHLSETGTAPMLPPAPALELVVEDFGAVGPRSSSCSQCTSCAVCIVTES
ncbi:TIGR04351 family putative TOMM peptide [Streptomyces sp. RB6PN25]|uniref:TIGR04351 family putative TOMM peptide n=1 Tax=Streptomyces humicola TaxID=2953240 RepID=A0ABT1Q2V8_9ACTN|nr:TIGR04351 family putative TOMM peptide [Streptomyces humicola]MCQ4084272.1 TIGR04351 family putative TOMM peptide [Streptomyces humicola]